MEVIIPETSYPQKINNKYHFMTKKLFNRVALSFVLVIALVSGIYQLHGYITDKKHCEKTTFELQIADYDTSEKAPVGSRVIITNLNTGQVICDRYDTIPLFIEELEWQSDYFIRMEIPKPGYYFINGDKYSVLAPGVACAELTTGKQTKMRMNVFVMKVRK